VDRVLGLPAAGQRYLRRCHAGHPNGGHLTRRFPDIQRRVRNLVRYLACGARSGCGISEEPSQRGDKRVVKRIRAKLGVGNKADLTLTAIELGRLGQAGRPACR
jgi:hypothetical protein